MNGSKNRLGLLRVPRVRVSADGVGVVSHAGVGLLREVAALSGLSAGVSDVLADTYKGPWLHDPGLVFTDLAAAVADGADCVSGIGQLVDQRALHGPVASVTTAWRLLDHRVDAAHLAGVKTARAAARARAWAAGGGPVAGSTLTIDIDATITIDHSDNKENAAATWKHTYGYHPLLAFLDRPDISAGEALAGLLRPGSAGSNTAADHAVVLAEALAGLPAAFRPSPVGPDRPDIIDGTRAPKLLVRTDSAGATHDFAKACRGAGVGFSFGFAVTEPVKAAITTLGQAAVTAHFDGINVWAETITTDGAIRDNGWIAEATGLVDLTVWPVGTRLILRKERPHPGAQLRFTDIDGYRITAFITDTPTGVVAGQLAGLDLRHRQHAGSKTASGRPKTPGCGTCHHFPANAAWLEVVMAATDLIAWTKLIGFADQPELARCEIAAFRYRVLHIARITRGARQIWLRLDATWRWATAIAQAWGRVRTAFT